MFCLNCGHKITFVHRSGKVIYFHKCLCQNTINAHTECDWCGCIKPEPEGNGTKGRRAFMFGKDAGKSFFGTGVDCSNVVAGKVNQKELDAITNEHDKRLRKEGAKQAWKEVRERIFMHTAKEEASYILADLRLFVGEKYRELKELKELE